MVYHSKRASLWMGVSCLTLLIVLAGIEPAEAGKLGKAKLADTVKRAYIYAYPVHRMYLTFYDDTYNRQNPNRRKVNTFQHTRILADHTFRDFTAPNNDTPYSKAWLDLSKEPVILSVPDTGDRYYVLALMDFYTNNFAYIGRRATGSKAGNYAIVGPQWKGAKVLDLPTIKSPTNIVWILGRTLVSGNEDLPNLHRMQDQYRLTPLSVWTKRNTMVKSVPNVTPPVPNREDPWNFFPIVNYALTHNKPPKDEAPLFAEFAKIGVGPKRKFDLERFSAEEKGIILKALKEADDEMREAPKKFPATETGWVFYPPNIGKFGKDYLFRAAIALYGIGALEPVEAMYMFCLFDTDWERLDGHNRYLLHFDKGGLPPVDAFWSMTMYEPAPDGRLFLTENLLGRYSIGDRTRGLRFNQDGSLDIFIQRESPGKESEVNWLPAPPGVFVLAMRSYLPRTPIMKGEYIMPGIKKLK